MIEDNENIGEPIDTIYKIDKKTKKITVIKCEEHPPHGCDVISREDYKEGTEECEEISKEIEEIKKTAKETGQKSEK